MRKFMNVTLYRPFQAVRKRVFVPLAAGVAGSLAWANAVFATLIDTSATGTLATTIDSAVTDYKAVFAMVLAAIVVIWALHRLKGVFFRTT